MSVATASRALSGNRPVSAPSLDVVTRAADALGYRPNRLAAALRRQVSDTIGLVVPQISNPFFPVLIESTHAALQAGTKQLLLCDSMQDPREEELRIQALIDHQVDGILIVPCDADRSLDTVLAAARRVPVVQVDRRIRGEAIDWVGADDGIAMQILVEHIAAMGASSAVFIGSDPSISSPAQDRLTAFTDAATRAGLSVLPALVGDFSAAWGAAAAEQLVARGPMPDAIVCANDLIALGLLRELIQIGIEVPDDTMLTGFDDIAAAKLSIPSLTTIRQPYEALAREAVRLLTERLEHSHAPIQRISISPELVVRESTSRT